MGDVPGKILGKLLLPRGCLVCVASKRSGAYACQEGRYVFGLYDTADQAFQLQVGSVWSGDLLLVLESQFRMVKVLTPDCAQGWIFARDVDFVQELA